MPHTAGRTPRRLFLALWPDAELCKKLYALGGELLAHGRGRRISRENLHLTLAFLGTVEPERQVCLAREISAVQAPDFTLTLDQAGCWPRKGILWAGGTPPDGLLALVRALHQRLAGCGFEPDMRPFQAHVTLARDVRGVRLRRDQAAGPLVWPVRQFSMVASQTPPEGARYEVLRTWELG